MSLRPEGDRIYKGCKRRHSRHRRVRRKSRMGHEARPEGAGEYGYNQPSGRHRRMYRIRPGCGGGHPPYGLHPGHTPHRRSAPVQRQCSTRSTARKFVLFEFAALPVFVNADGNRFADEGGRRDAITDACLGQPPFEPAPLRSGVLPSRK